MISRGDIMTQKEQILGAMLGLACGDALGAPAEFHTQQEVHWRWGTLTEMVGGGLWSPGEWTDDTGMTLCMAEGILENPPDPVPAVGRRFLEWQPTAKDVGTTISAALSGFQGDWPEAARRTPQAQSGKAAGNGALMRTLPVALAEPNEARMLALSARLSAMTHWDPQAEACCAVYCLWVQNLLSGQNIKAAWYAALAWAQTLAPTPTPDTPGMSPLPAGFWERLHAVEGLAYEALQPSGYAGYVLECLEAAAWCCLHAQDPEEALVRAVNLAGEADTIAAVAGGILGTFWGPDALPQSWRDALYERGRLQDVARHLADLRRVKETL
jgi:ADP-ribosyl-[dinitrogen reductase] hydrolase